MRAGVGRGSIYRTEACVVLAGARKLSLQGLFVRSLRLEARDALERAVVFVLQTLQGEKEGGAGE